MGADPYFWASSDLNFRVYVRKQYHSYLKITLSICYSSDITH